ncbi:hypothetical protein [Thermoflexus sp.]|uniref:hypothetical protein n=1 Tax=Thermoflexus sp. TaxID=1969742 RepID=UPI002ADDFCB0|nr:hypothetical protein [Thermoflexus sp.]
MKRKGFWAALIVLLLVIAALLATREAQPSPPSGFALVSEPSLRELGWEIEVDPRHAEWVVAEIARLLSPAPNRPGSGVSMLVWHPDSVGITDLHRVRVAGIFQALYPFASAAEAQRACKALPRRLSEWQQASAEEVRPLSIARGRGHLVVLQTEYVRSFFLIGCRGSALTVLWIASPNPQVPSELLPRLQSMVVGE